MIFKSVKYRLYPTKEQTVLLDKHINAYRFIYNLALETKQFAYSSAEINLSLFELMRQLPDLKEECTWLKEINALSLQAAIRQLDTAYTNFFKGRANFPKFKSEKYSRKSFKLLRGIKIENNSICIPKFKTNIKAAISRHIIGDIKCGTISKTPTGKYFISMSIEVNEKIPLKPTITKENTIGVDLGIKDYAILSTGEKIANPRFLKKSIKKLKYIQRKYSKYKGKRTRLKLALLHEKIVNQRKDFLHKITKKLVDDNQTIAIEDLGVKNMMKNHKLAQAIQDVSWGTFETFIKYKSDWYGTNLLQIGRFEPSSRMSDCGQVNKELTLKDRTWTCKHCGNIYDRDIQAAKNIKKFALRNHVSGVDTKNHSELPTLVGVLTCEA